MIVRGYTSAEGEVLSHYNVYNVAKNVRQTNTNLTYHKYLAKSKHRNTRHSENAYHRPLNIYRTYRAVATGKFSF